MSKTRAAVLFTIVLLFAVAFESLAERRMARGPERMANSLLGFALVADGLPSGAPGLFVVSP